MHCLLFGFFRFLCFFFFFHLLLREVKSDKYKRAYVPRQKERKWHMASILAHGSSYFVLFFLFYNLDHNLFHIMKRFKTK
jgi:hypothetical protein